MLLLKVTAGMWFCAVLAGIVLHRGKLARAKLCLQLFLMSSLGRQMGGIEQGGVKVKITEMMSSATEWEAEMGPPCRFDFRAAVDHQEKLAHAVVRSSP